MTLRKLSTLLLGLLGLLVLSASAFAAGTVQLELLSDTRGSALLAQEWAQTLGKAGIRDVRIRTGDEDAKPAIDVQGTSANPIYVVTGLIKSRDEIVLPGGRYRRADMARLARWLKDLAERGPNAGREEKAAFGLTAAQFTEVHKDLARPVGFSTRGMSVRQAVEKIAGQLRLPLRLDADVAEVLASEKVKDELEALSCGTALACSLRQAGYGLVPRDAPGQVGYAVVKAASGMEVWPIGWEPVASLRDTLPALYEFHNINLTNVPAAQPLGAIAKWIKAPVLLDHYALAKHNIDLDKAKVSLPRSRTTYSLTLRKILFQARLKFDVRQDEAGAPLVWITTIAAVKP